MVDGVAGDLGALPVAVLGVCRAVGEIATRYAGSKPNQQAMGVSLLLPLIELNHSRSIGPLDHDSPAARSAARRERVRADFVDAVAARLCGANRGLNLLDWFDIITKSSLPLIRIIDAHSMHTREPLP
jgi:hypothetical protein